MPEQSLSNPSPLEFTIILLFYLRLPQPGGPDPCNRKVLLPANSIKVFRGFPWFQSKCWIVIEIPRFTACFTFSPPNGNIKNFDHMWPCSYLIKIRSNTAPLQPRGLGTSDWLSVLMLLWLLSLTLDWTTLFLWDINTGTWPSRSCATLTSTWLHCKLQTRTLVREGALHEEERN
jgi:hypothetical protein